MLLNVRRVSKNLQPKTKLVMFVKLKDFKKLQALYFYYDYYYDPTTFELQLQFVYLVHSKLISHRQVVGATAKCEVIKS